MQFQDENNGGSFEYVYSYNQAGHVVENDYDYEVGSLNPLHFSATYGWDVVD